MFHIAVFAVDGRVAPVAKEGLLAFLDPAGVGVGAVDDPGLTLLILHVLARPGRAGDDGGVDDGPAGALHFQPALLKLAVDERQQFLIQLGLDQAIAEAADGAGVGQFTATGLKAGKDHEVQAHAQRLLQLGV